MSEKRWQKSSFSEEGGNNCVELALISRERIALRESLAPNAVMTVRGRALRALLLSTKAGRLNALGR